MSDIERPGRRFAFPLNKDGTLRIPGRVRERYLADGVEAVVCHAAGYSLNIWVWSDRDNIVIQLPLDDFRAERVYDRSLYRWGINVNRWLTPGKSNDDNGVYGWWNPGTLKVGYGSEDNRDMVAGYVVTHDWEDPR